MVSPAANISSPSTLAATHAAHVSLLEKRITSLKAENSSLECQLKTLKREFAKLKKCQDHYRSETKRLRVALNTEASRPDFGLDIKPSGSFVCASNINEYGSNLDSTFALHLPIDE